MPGELFLLALGSAAWPVLIAVVLVAARSPDPPRLLGCFYAGAILTTVTLGLAIVALLRQTGVLDHYSRASVGPGIDLVLGVVALLLGTAVSRRGRREPAKTSAKKASWWEPVLARGAALAFVVGIVLNIIPGVLPFVALKDIADGGYTVAATVALVVGFYLVMFVLVEVPLALYVLAPARADAAVVALNAWLDRNGRRTAALALVGVGVYLIVRGIIGFAS